MFLNKPDHTTFRSHNFDYVSRSNFFYTFIQSTISNSDIIAYLFATYYYMHSEYYLSKYGYNKHINV